MGGLPADPGHAGGICHPHLAAHALAEQPLPLGVSLALGCWDTGGPLLAGNLDNSQLGGDLPICRYSDVNNLLALNS